MKRIGVIGMFHETNSFAPNMTEIAHFKEKTTEGLSALLEANHNARTTYKGYIDAIQSRGMELAAGLCLKANPSGCITTAAGEGILRSVTDSIPENCDALAISLHGAMLSETYDDMEGELLERIRKQMGFEIPIAITVDLHANISQRMVQHADLIVGYDTYPHVDMYDRAVEAINLLVDFIQGDVDPTIVMSRPQMLVAPQSMITTVENSMRELMDKALAMELIPGVLNVTVCGGFPYSDARDAGMSFLVTTDGDERLAHSLADELCQTAKDLEEGFVVTGSTVEQALQELEDYEERPVVLIEGSDNVGAGAPGDATHILVHLLESSQKSLIVICDEEAVRQASKLSQGDKFRGEIGAKSSVINGKPVQVEGTIKSQSNGQYRHLGPTNTGMLADMGWTVVLEVRSVTIILTEKRAIPFDINHVSSVGVDPSKYDLIIVKAAVAWRAAFGKIAKKAIQVDTPGCCSFNLKRFTYKRYKGPILPLGPK